MTVPTRCEFRVPKGLPKGNVLAFFDLHYGDFVIKDFKVLKGANGEPWIAMPSRPVGKDTDKYVVTTWIQDPGRRKAFSDFALNYYHRFLKEQEAESAAS